MNWEYQGVAMGQNVDEEGFDWDTGEYVTDSSGSNGGLTEQGAQVITGITDALTDLGTTAMRIFGTQPSSGGTAATPGAVTPVAPTGTYQPVQRAGMDPVVLAAIGIPVALIAAMALRPRGRK